MKLQSYEVCPHGILIRSNEGFLLRIEAWSSKIIRLSCAKETLPEKSIYGDLVVGTPGDCEFSVDDDGTQLTFSTACAAVSVRRATFGIRFFRDGKEICSLSRWGMQLRDTVITKPIYEPDMEDGTHLKLIRTEERHGYRFYVSFDFGIDEKIYGLGQNVTGAVNRREAATYLYQHNNTAPVPSFVSSRGYGVFVNTEAFSTFRRDEFGTTFFTDAVELGDWFFIASENIDEAVSGFRTLTGQAPMMPKWLFGYTQSKERYCTQEELLSVLREYRKRKVPIDQIVQDWNYWPDGTWSDKSFDESRYPDPDAMCREIHDSHAHVMISVWPNTRGGECFRELFSKNQMLTDTGTYGGGGTYNAFDEGACDTYWKQLSEGIFSHGFDAWWCDSSEPFEPDYGGYHTPEEQKDISLSVYRKWMDSSRINVFSLLNSRNIYEHQRKETSEKRVVNLTRSGYAGQQRYSGLVWSGDIGASFEEMRRQIAEGLSYTVSGLPYWTLDVGGFHPAHGDALFNSAVPYNSPANPGWHELYTRWIQFGCFLPVFRSHGTGFPREIWRFGEEGTMFYDSIRKFIGLRYRLMPYIYSTAWQVTKNAASFIRLTAFDFPDDREALEHCADTYMFGRSLLVSPVTEPMYYEGADTPLSDVPKTKEVYLPAGADWYDFWTDKRFEGGQTVTIDTPIDSMPLFVRAGSILPMTQEMQYADEIPDAPYEITVYPGCNGSFTVYEDSGDSYDYENGAYAEFDLMWNDALRTLIVSERRGSFEGMCVSRILRIRTAGGECREILYDGKEQAICL